LRDCGETEIGGFGLTAVDDPLLVIDILTVKQRCSVVTVAFDDGAVADLFDRMVDQGIPPARFSRIWLHTHPANCPLPSSTDEATFRRVFGRTDWSVMAILARDGSTYARLSFHVGPGGAIEIPVEVDWNRPFGATDRENWHREYLAHVSCDHPPEMLTGAREEDFLDDWLFEPWQWEEIHDEQAGSRPV